MKSKLLNFTIKDDLREQLMKFVKKDGRSLSEILRQAVVEFLKNQNKEK